MAIKSVKQETFSSLKELNEWIDNKEEPIKIIGIQVVEVVLILFWGEVA